MCSVASADELTGTLKKVKDTGVVTIGYRESSVPFSYLNDKQEPIGYAIDICLKVVDSLKSRLKLDKLQVKFNPVTSATRIPLVANGTVDLACGSAFNTLERQKQVAFGNTYFLTANRFVSKKSDHINSIADDLKGQSVVSTSGTVNIQQLYEVNATQELGMNVIAANDHAQAFLMVESGRAKAFFMDDILLASFVAGAKDPSAYVISEEALSNPQPYAMIIRKGDPEFKAFVDEATAALYKSPEMLALYDKWFNQPIPPHDLNLNVPLSPALKRAFEHPSDSADPASYVQ
jgi:glutamate/aspartate transport system substrate-binding protein